MSRLDKQSATPPAATPEPAGAVEAVGLFSEAQRVLKQCHRPDLVEAVQQVAERRASLALEVDRLTAALSTLTTSTAHREQQVREAWEVAADRGKRLYRALSDLAGMYNQYTPGEFGHDFMSAGEDAQDALSAEGLLDKQSNAIYPEDDNAPKAVKDLLLPAARPEHWIPVGERLPYHCEVCLLARKSNYHPGGHSVVQRTYAYDRQKNDWWLTSKPERRIPAEEVTYWMPPPTPPTDATT